MDPHELTPPYFRWLVHLIRPFPNFDLFFVRALRQKAVHALQLKAGSRVLDVGCGPGGSFPYLVEAVGPSGEVVGVEISPEVSINARRRIEANRWSNVQLVEGDARTVQLNGNFRNVVVGCPRRLRFSGGCRQPPSIFERRCANCCLRRQTLPPSSRYGS